MKKQLSLFATLCVALTMNAQTAGEPIDLGLSVKWHSCNYGASKPSEKGTTYAFADTKAGGYSSQMMYPFFDMDIWSYNLPTGNIAGTAKDAAWAGSDGSFRMASNDEWQELFDNCNITSSTVDGASGMLFTSKINGNSIFIPETPDSWGNYSMTYYTSEAASSTEATVTSASGSSMKLSKSSTPYTGRPIRPVVEEVGSPLTGINLTVTQPVLYAGTRMQLKANPVPDDAKVRNAVWTSSNPEVATVSNKGLVTGIAEGSVTITATCGEISGSVVLNVVKVVTPADEEYVDLGLSVRWAAKNLGATDTNIKGDKYPWGYLTPDVVNSAQDYKFFSKATFQYALPSTDICGNPLYDAVAAATDGKAQLPNDQQIAELLENCDYVSATVDGVQGLLLTSRKNGKSIFLPTPQSTVMFYSGTTNSGKTYVNVLRYDSPDQLTATTQSQPYMQWWLRGIQYNTDVKLESLTMSKEELSLYVLNTAELSVTPTPLDYKVENVAWSTSDSSIAIVTKTGLVIAQAPGECEIYAEIDGVRAVCHLTVSEIQVASGESVNMGSQLLWRTCNLGASNPWELGKYYGFGAVEPNETVTDYPDNICGTNYDVAYTTLGGTWHMPSQDDFMTLIENTEMEWVNWNGTSGALLTSKINGNKLFFPVNKFGQIYYNTCQLQPGSNIAHAYHATEQGQGLGGISTNSLLPVRAVCSDIDTGADSIADENVTSDIYTLSGILVKKGADKTFIDALPAGLYIINGRKVAK